jgi:hypothetical protein
MSTINGQKPGTIIIIGVILCCVLIAINSFVGYYTNRQMSIEIEDHGIAIIPVMELNDAPHCFDHVKLAVIVSSKNE